MAASASFLTVYIIQYSMPGGDTSNGQSGVVALDLKHSGEIAEKLAALEGEI